MTEQQEKYAILSVSGVPGTLHIYNPRDNAPRHVQTHCHVRGPCAAVTTSTTLLALTQSPNSTTASLCTYDLSRTSGAAVRKSASIEPLTVLTTSHSGGLLAAGASSGRVHIWHLPTGTLLSSFSAHLHRITALAFTDDDDLLLTASADALVNAFSVATVVDSQRNPTETPEPVIRLTAHTLPVVAMAVGYAGVAARVATAASDRTLRIWHLASASCLATLLLPSPAVQIAFSSHESVIFVGLVDGTIMSTSLPNLPFGSVRSVQQSDCIPPPPSPSDDLLAVTTLSLSPNCCELVVGYSDGVVRIYDVGSRVQIHSYSKHSTTAPITFVMTLPRIPVAFEHTRNEFPAISRSQPLDAVKCTSSSIDLSSAPGFHTLACRMNDDAVALNFEERDVPDDSDAMDSHGSGTRREEKLLPLKKREDDVVLEKLVHEVAFLRKRNNELESAGNKLSDLVERQFT